MLKNNILFCLSLFLLINCNQPKNEVSKSFELKTMLAKECKRVMVLFYVNFATSKTSLVAKDVRDKNSIDSIISYLGEEKKDTICYHFSENPVGEIYFYADTAMLRALMSMDFILVGKCRGFYPVNEKIYPSFEITPLGKMTLENLRNKFKRHL